MDIEAGAEVDLMEWSRLVDEDGAATFFHTPEWADVLTSTLPGFRAHHFCARREGGLIAMMPTLSCVLQRR